MLANVGYLFKLADRSINVIHGKDCIKLLQGLCTNDIDKFVSSPQWGMNSLFLDPKGRIQCHAIIVKAPSFVDYDPAFFIDTHINQSSILMAYIKQHAFRKDVKVDNLDELMSVYATASPVSIPEEPEGARQFFDEIGEPPKIDEDLGRMLYGYTCFVDPRCKLLGTRTITEQDCLEIEEDSGIVEKGSEHYRYLRILLGIPEGPPICNEIPQMLNFDLLNTISYNKGCYVGQELMARVHTQGVVRTRTYPFLITDKLEGLTDAVHPPVEFVDEACDLNLSGKRIVNDKGEVVGEIFEAVKNIGLLKIRGGLKQNIYKTENDIKLLVWKPYWCNETSSSTTIE
ncbi:CAF17 [Blepharisma stoltei]|uniref:Aminomethyltransferase folate-binding domain-containing protein n=1 Tax=Blepharisma stoltei TaxID=1481888 RepID=A0AAU9J090_9CILI|nr:unnamed protein product [Blepharisma stoltei]